MCLLFTGFSASSYFCFSEYFKLCKTSAIFSVPSGGIAEVGWSIVWKIFLSIYLIFRCPRRALLVRGLPQRAPARRIWTAGRSPIPRTAYKHELVANLYLKHNYYCFVAVPVPTILTDLERL